MVKVPKSQLSSTRDVLLSSLAGYCISHLVCGPVSVGLVRRKQILTAHSGSGSKQNCARLSLRNCSHIAGTLRNPETAYCWDLTQPRNSILLGPYTTQKQHIAGTLHNPETAYCWDLTQPRNSILLGPYTTQKQHIAGTLHNPETAYCWYLTQPRNSILLGPYTTQKQHIAVSQSCKVPAICSLVPF